MKKIVAGLLIASALTISAGSALAGEASGEQGRATFVQAQEAIPETLDPERTGNCDQTQDTNSPSNTL